MRKQYANPPIAEAICDLTFAGTSKWSDSVIPGKFHDLVKNVYDGETQEQQQFQTQVKVGPKGEIHTVSPSTSQSRTLIFNSSKTLLAAIRPNGLGTHSLKPYCGWDKFRERIVADSDAYTQLTETNQINRIGLRYINKILLPGTTVELSDYFAIAPKAQSLKDWPISQFVFKTVSAVDIGERRKCTVSVTLADPRSMGMPNEDNFVVLDIDVVTGSEKQMIEIAERMNIIDSMKALQREAFESAILDLCRETFK
jgi:uncharacterized protein (TIGR04255 family)